MKHDIFQFSVLNHRRHLVETFVVLLISESNHAWVSSSNQEAMCQVPCREGEGEYLMGRRVLYVDRDNRLLGTLGQRV